MTSSRQNPLIPDILQILQRNLHAERASPFGIHHLLTELAHHPCFDALADQSELNLFKKNFLMMNALYQLRCSLWEEERLLLQLETLDVRLLALSDTEAESERLATKDPMESYYLDWRHYTDTTQEQVEALLDEFWCRYARSEGGQQNRVQGLGCLGLTGEPSQAEIKRRYRELAREHHPDRGGDAIRFIEIRQAYEALRH